MVAARPGRALVVAIAVLGVTGGCVRFNKFYNATSDFAEAERLARQRGQGARVSAAESKKYQACIARCQEIVTEHPESGFVDDCMLLVGKCWLRQAEYGKAERWLQRLTDEYPHSALAEEGSYLLGVAARLDGRPSMATSSLARFLASYPESHWRGEALLELMISLADSEREDSALAVGQRALSEGKLGSVKDRIRYEAGSLLLDGGEWEAAERMFALAAEGKDRTIRFEASLRRGDALETGGRLDEAAALYERLEGEARADSQIAKAGLALAEVDVARGRTDQALEKLADIAELFPTTPQASQAHYRMAWLYVSRLGDLETAEGHFSKASQGRRVAQNARAALESIKKLTQFREALADTGSAALWLRAGECYLFDLEVPESAAVCYRRAMDLGDSVLSPRASLALASVLDQTGHGPEAREILEDLLTTYPATSQAAEARERLSLPAADSNDPTPVHASLYADGERALLDGDYESAADLFEAATKASTDDEWAAKAHYATAWILEEKLDRREEALRTYEELVERYPASPYGREAASRLGLGAVDTAGAEGVSSPEPKTTLAVRCDTTGYGVPEVIRVRVRVLPDGRAAEVSIESGSGSLACDEEAQDVAQRASYVPAKKGGTPQEGWWEGTVEVLPLYVEQPPDITVLEPQEGELDSLPVFTVYRSPDYPAGLLVLAEGEEVVLRLDLDESGIVTSTRIEQAPEAVRQILLQAVSGWRFRAAYAGGEPVACSIHVSFRVERTRR